MKGWSQRGYLPHYDGGEIWQFVTIHLGDALPAAVVRVWQQELKIRQARNIELDLILRRKIEKYLDKGFGNCFLRDARLAKMTQNALRHFDGARYKLAAWVVMPNHIHFLLKPFPEIEMSTILHSIKSYTASTANKMLRRKGQFWQEDYFDRFIRDAEHFTKTVHYIENNPVKAGLCEKPDDWPYSSAYRENGYGARASLPA